VGCGITSPAYTAPVADPRIEAQWRALLTGEHPGVWHLRRAFRNLPSPPHCKLCYAPFGGPGGFVLRPWFGPWERNPQLCKNCIKGLVKLGVGGAEVPLSMVFADIRGSTGLGERLRPAEFSALLNAFYRIAADAITTYDGIVDKFVGDEIIGIFVPSMATPQHAAIALDAARTLLTETGFGTPSGPWVPIGIGVNTGVAYVGSIGDGSDTELTAMGDVVNVTARLSSMAGPGEILVTTAAASAAGLSIDLPRRSLHLKGKSQATDVVVVTA
jgi:adenylate cyclase